MPSSAVPRAVRAPRPGRAWRGRFAAAVALLLSACAGTPPPTGNWALSGLGRPVMTPTAVGTLASWTVPGATADALPLVLWPSILADHTMYRDLVAALRGRYRLLLVDGPGHGASGPPPEAGFTMAQCAAALREVLRAHGVPRAAVGGTSWGGLVATEFALAHPQETIAVVAMNTPYRMPAEGPGLADRLIVRATRHAVNTPLFAWGVGRSFFLPETRSAGGDTLRAFDDHLRRADGAAMAVAVKAVLLDRPTMHDRLAVVRAPVLVIAGLEDAMYPLQEQARLAATLPSGTFAAVPSRHLSAVDAPAAVARSIDDFLTPLAPR